VNRSKYLWTFVEQHLAQFKRGTARPIGQPEGTGSQRRAQDEVRFVTVFARYV
jgi:hypothetical protein